MSDWLPTLQRVATWARNNHPDPEVRLGSIVDVLHKAAEEAQEPVTRAVARLQSIGDALPGLKAWERLCELDGETGPEELAAWHTESDRRARRITPADLASVEGLSDAAAAAQLGRTRQGVWQARKRAKS